MLKLWIDLTSNSQMSGEVPIEGPIVLDCYSGSDSHQLEILVQGGSQSRAAYTRHPESKHLERINFSGDEQLEMKPHFAAVVGSRNLMIACSISPATPEGRRLTYKVELAQPDTRLLANVANAVDQTMESDGQRWFLINGTARDGSLATLGFKGEQLREVAHLIHQACSPEDRIQLAQWLLGHTTLTLAPTNDALPPSEVVRAGFLAQSIEVGKTWDGKAAIGIGLDGGGLATFWLTEDLTEAIRVGLDNLSTVSPGPRPGDTLN